MDHFACPFAENSSFDDSGAVLPDFLLKTDQSPDSVIITPKMVVRILADHDPLTLPVLI